MKKKHILFLGVCIILILSFQLVSAQAKAVHKSRDLPLGFPNISVKHMDNPGPGNFFIAPFGAWGMFLDGDPYIAIIDNYAYPLYYKRVNHAHINDFKLQENGQLTFSGYTGQKHHIMNEQMEIVDSITPIGYWPDFHEIILQADGSKIVLGMDTRLVDMSTIVPGGRPDATLIGYVVQQLDANNNLVFEWNTWDHYNILDCQDYVDLTAASIDLSHVNTIEVDTDTSLLILARNMNEITRISRQTGEIIWRLGGANNEFTFINDTLQWAWPHDIRRIGHGLYSIFDNGRFNTPAPHFSSGVIYTIDESNKTITQVERFKNTPHVYGDIMGNFQVLENGNYVTGWGSGSYPDSIAITEFNPDGNAELIISMGAINYRAWKHNWQPKLFAPESDTLDFGQILSEPPILKNITLFNFADYDVELSGYHFRFGEFSCETQFPLTLPANGSADLSIRFEPENAGIFHDAFTVYTENSSQTERIGRQVFLKAQVEQGYGFNDPGTETLDVFPNPTNGRVQINLTRVSTGYARLFNGIGEFVQEFPFEQTQFVGVDLSTMPNGLYVAKLTTSEGDIFTAKIVNQ